MERAAFERRLAVRAESWNRRDIEALTDDHAENGTVQSDIAGEVRGRPLIRDLYRRWFLAFPDLTFQYDRVVIDADVAVVLWTLEGTHRAKFLGVAPTGRRMRFSGVFVYLFSAELIQWERRFVDLAGVVVQAVGGD